MYAHYTYMCVCFQIHYTTIIITSSNCLVPNNISLKADLFMVGNKQHPHFLLFHIVKYSIAKPKKLMSNMYMTMQVLAFGVMFCVSLVVGWFLVYSFYPAAVSPLNPPHSFLHSFIQLVVSIFVMQYTSIALGFQTRSF